MRAPVIATAQVAAPELDADLQALPPQRSRVAPIPDRWTEIQAGDVIFKQDGERASLVMQCQAIGAELVVILRDLNPGAQSSADAFGAPEQKVLAVDAHPMEEGYGAIRRGMYTRGEIESLNDTQVMYNFRHRN